MSALGRNPFKLGYRLWSTARGATAIGEMVWDPVKSQSYYPEQPRKSRAAILFDLLWWHLRFDEINKYYYLYGLDRRDTNDASLMPYNLFRAMRNARNLRPAGLSDHYGTSYNFVCVLRDKFVFSQFARSLGFPVAKPWAILTQQSVFWLDGGERMPLERLIGSNSLSIDGIAKPVDGINGRDVFALRIANGTLFIDDAPSTFEALKARLTRRYLLESRLQQHPALARLHPQSINTVRLVTFYRDGDVVLFTAAFRAGTGGSTTDNWTSGGVLVSIDPQSGTLRGDGYLKPGFGQRVSRHPDSGLPFDGFVVPHFAEAVDLVRRFHSYLPGIHSIGWDIAITPEGPAVIEANDDWDGAVAMIVDRDFRRRYTAMF